MYTVGHKRGANWWLILAVTVVSLALLYFTGALAWLLGLFNRATSPLQSLFYSSSADIKGQQSRDELLKENNGLKEKIGELAPDESRLKELEIENQLLRQQLNFVEGHGYNFVTARVVSQGSQDNIAVFIINRGEADGIKLGYPVMAGDGVVVGRIVEVTNNQATFLALTDNRSRLAATVQNNDATIGLVEGEHGISIKMDMIPRDEEVKPGQIIITSGLQENIPRGLLIGLVDKIDDTSSELFKKAYLYPLVDYHKLNIVTVFLP